MKGCFLPLLFFQWCSAINGFDLHRYQQLFSTRIRHSRVRRGILLHSKRQELAQKWMEGEMEFYRGSTGYSPIITRETAIIPPIRHLEAACKEFQRRFSFQDNDDDEVTPNSSPVLLVANHVKDSWRIPDGFNHVQFIKVPGDAKDESALFIKSMAGSLHGVLHGEFVVGIESWIMTNGLDGILVRVVNGGEYDAPNRAYRPDVPDKCNPTLDVCRNLKEKPHPRLVIEVDYANRDGRALREVGYLAMDNPYTRLFIGIKIWPKKHDITGNTFAAAVVLWGKNEHGVVSVRKAVDFGTKPLDSARKAFFESSDMASGDMVLPPVKEWTRPLPSPGHDSLLSELESMTLREISNRLPVKADWGLTLPAEDILFQTSTVDSTDNKPYYLDDVPLVPDCKINLQVYARKVHRNLGEPKR